MIMKHISTWIKGIAIGIVAGLIVYGITRYNKYIITYPADGAIVNMHEKVQGKTPYIELNHYIVVTPIANGTDYIQDGPANVTSNGRFVGTAAFGTMGVQGPQQFIVRVIATKATLLSPSDKIPQDSKISSSITVNRIR